MNIGNKSRALIAVLTAIIYNCACTFPHLGWYWLTNILRKRDTEYRNGMCRRMTNHGERLFRLLCSILDITVDFCADDKLHGLQKPLIVIVNHQSIMDIPLLFAVMKWLNLPHVRWIMKENIGLTPFGWFSKQVHSAFVSRKNGVKDIKAVTTCGEYAQNDHAAVVLFPEGTRFTRTIQNSGLTHLRPPKVGGFECLVRTMPNADIVSITLCWTQNGQGRHAARTVFDADGLVGKRVIIRTKRIEAASFENTKDWLQAHWLEKDLELEHLV